MGDVRKLREAVEAEQKVTIPTPHKHARQNWPDLTARIMGYAEGYVVLRHKGAAPFVVPKKEVIAILRALEGGGDG